MSDQTRFLLNESDLPRFWYNVNGDNPVPPAPVLHPQTLQPVTPDFLSVLFPMDLILQEVSTERFIEIPEPVREIYKLYRPTPLIRARRLEQMLGTKIFLELHVKVQEDWRDRPAIVKQLDWHRQLEQISERQDSDS